MTDLPDVKLRAVVNFPAVVNGGIGVAVTKNSGTYTFDLDYGEIALVTSIPPASIPTTSILLWDSLRRGLFANDVSWISRGAVSEEYFLIWQFFPKVKLKAIVSFPATILDGIGIDVAGSNGAPTSEFDLAFDDFALSAGTACSGPDTSKCRCCAGTTPRTNIPSWCRFLSWRPAARSQKRRSTVATCTAEKMPLVR